jgi:hypothetical protein
LFLETKAFISNQFVFLFTFITYTVYVARHAVFWTRNESTNIEIHIKGQKWFLVEIPANTIILGCTHSAVVKTF